MTPGQSSLPAFGGVATSTHLLPGHFQTVEQDKRGLAESFGVPINNGFPEQEVDVTGVSPLVNDPNVPVQPKADWKVDIGGFRGKRGHQSFAL